MGNTDPTRERLLQTVHFSHITDVGNITTQKCAGGRGVIASTGKGMRKQLKSVHISGMGCVSNFLRGRDVQNLIGLEGAGPEFFQWQKRVKIEKGKKERGER